MNRQLRFRKIATFGLVLPAPMLVFAATLIFANSSALAASDPDEENQSSEPNAPKFDYMHTRAEWEILKQRSYPSETPFDGPTLSEQQRRAVAQLESLERQAGVPQIPLTWTNIGPGPVTVPPAHCQYGAQNSGRIISFAADPANSLHWLIGSASGGIWQTTNGGTSWMPKTDDQGSLSTDAIAFSADPNIVYASLRSTGLLKSTNGGNNWTLIHTNCGSGLDCFSGRGARAFLVSPSNSKVAVAALEGGSGSTYGIYRTADGGGTWTQKISHQATALVSVANDFSKQYAAIGEPVNEPSNLLFRSIDSGQTWTFVAGPWDYVTDAYSLAIAPSNPNVLYVWAKNQTGTSAPIWKTSNAWDPNPTWTQLPFMDSSHPEKFGRALSVDPSNPDVLYAGEVRPWRYDGVQWTDILGCTPNGTHVDSWDMKWLNNYLILTNDGGIFRTSDGGSNWQSLNGDLSIAQFYWASLHPTNGNFGLGGVQDNGTPVWSGTKSWSQIWGGDGMSNAISLTQPNTNWLVSNSSQGIHRTRDGITIDGVDVSQDIDHTCAPFFSRFVSCPSSDQVVIAGTTKLWRTTNNAFTDNQPHWSVNSPDLNDCPPGHCCNGIFAIEFSPSDTSCNTYAIAGGPKILATTIGGGINNANWFTLAPMAPLPSAAVTDVAFDPSPFRSRRLYATFSGTGHGHLYVCNDITSPAWTEIPTPLDISHNAIAIDPNNVNNLFVGTDLGLLVSTNGGTTWTSLGTNQIPKVRIWDIQVNRATNKIIVFTYGRGAYSGTLTPAGPMLPKDWHREPLKSERVQKATPLQALWFGVGAFLERWWSFSR
jgi:photosystem II stability/assembly factor-like uncharacterized protein